MKKIMIACSTSFYSKIESVKDKLINYEIIYPNHYGENEDNYDSMNEEDYNNFFKECFISSKEKVNSCDILFVLNYEKKGIPNYIGASTFLEMYLAFMQNKNIYLLNELPNSNFMLYDEIKSFKPLMLHGNVDNIINLEAKNEKY